MRVFAVKIGALKWVITLAAINFGGPVKFHPRLTHRRVRTRYGRLRALECLSCLVGLFQGDEGDVFTQGCSMLNALIVQDSVQLDGVVVERDTNVGLAVVAQQVQGEVTQVGEDTGVASNPTGIFTQ